MDIHREEGAVPHTEESKCCCEKPENLTGKPEECSEEQIRECHGDDSEHSCCCSEERGE